MLFLHTSDWHLGATAGEESLWEDQRFFIDELCGIVRERQVDALLLAGVKHVALLGTMTTMKEPFYKEVLLQKGLAVYVPSEEDGLEIDRIIFHELCQGEVVEASRQRGYKIIGALKERGAEAVILGCTELDLLLSDEASALPLFDTTRIHAEAIANYMMSD